MGDADRIRVTCPKCGAGIRAKQEHIGRTVACPKCNGPVNVALPVGDEDPPPLPRRPASGRDVAGGSPQMTALRNTLIVAGAIVVAGGLIALALRGSGSSGPTQVKVEPKPQESPRSESNQGSTQPVSRPTPKPQEDDPQPPPKASDKRMAVNATGHQGAYLNGFIVDVHSARVGKVEFEDGNVSAEEFLIIKLLISRFDKDAKSAEYFTWSSDTGGEGSPLTESGGRKLERVHFGFNPLKGRDISETVSRSKVAHDVLVFQKPSRSAEYLDLDLPGRKLADGVFRFRIDRSEWTK
jgi:hypothetical protein